MAALYALGMMSLTWMVLVTALIAVERLLPRPAAAVRGVALVLAVLGLAVALAPRAVPALTVPSSAHTMTAAPGGTMNGPGM